MNTASPLGSGIEAPPRWSLRLLGGCEISALLNGERVTSLGKRERVLLAFLALSQNCRQPRRKLATLLWGDSADDTALDNLRTSVWRLRKALGDTGHRFLISEGEEIALDAAALEIDALAFDRLAAQSGRSELEAAAKLYAGEFLDGLTIESEEFETWRRAEAMHYRDQAIDVLTRLMLKWGECGETERAIATGTRILRLEPLHEATARRLMRLYAESGRRAAAVQLYRALAEALRTELGAHPEAETRLVFGEIAGGGEAPIAADAKDTKPPGLSTNTKRPSEMSGGPPPARPAVRRRVPLAVVAGALAIVIAIIFYPQFGYSPLTAERQPGIAEERSASASQVSAISIAVLPFTNMSGDSSQEFFSDGMTEEITAALAKVPDLKVVARSSAFQFKAQNRDIQSIGQQLHATHFIEGSVRKEGDRVRITAQLIEAGNGVHIWTESYDRQLSDIFTTQEEIARTIVSSLMAPLGLAPGERLVSSRTVDPESYQQYIRAKALVRTRGLKSLTDAAALLEQVVVRNPDYAPAWALLAQAYVFVPMFHPAIQVGDVDELRTVVNASLPRAEAAARRAIQLDPNHADGYVSLGHVQDVRGKLLEAQDLYSKALELDPTNPDGLNRFGNLLAAAGHIKEGLAMRQRLLALEPFVPPFNYSTAVLLWADGQHDAAMTMGEALSPNIGQGVVLAFIRAADGRYNEAADALLQVPPVTYPRATVEAAAHLLRTAPAAVASPQALPPLGSLNFVYLHIGAANRAIEFHEGNVHAGYSVAIEMAMLWHASYAPVRKTERFKAYARAAGLVDYWRARGWPALCRPIDVDDFVCA